MEQQQESAQENRAYERRLVRRLLSLLNADTEVPIGTVVNISRGGFMLLGPSPVSENALLRARLELPYPIAGARTASFEARCVWCRRSSYSDDYGVGFQIESIGARDLYRIETLFGSV